MASMAKKILVEVPDDLAEALDRLREKEGETRLTIIRMLLKEALTARKAWPPKGKA
jgi:metal-responsive CopG/Arc/MetJ family transcriptional regulator